jgi:hypothetical protein
MGSSLVVCLVMISIVKSFRKSARVNFNPHSTTNSYSITSITKLYNFRSNSHHDPSLNPYSNPTPNANPKLNRSFKTLKTDNDKEGETKVEISWGLG